MLVMVVQSSMGCWVGSSWFGDGCMGHRPRENEILTLAVPKVNIAQDCSLHDEAQIASDVLVDPCMDLALEIFRFEMLQ